MGGRIALLMMVTIAKRDHLVEFHQDVPGYTGIRIFVNGNAGSGVRYKDLTDTGFDPAFIYRLLNLLGNIDKLGLRICSDI